MGCPVQDEEDHMVSQEPAHAAGVRSSGEGSDESPRWRHLPVHEMRDVKLAALGGEVAAARWNDALNALHAYAQASDALAGQDVISWFAERSDAYRAALKAAHYASPPPTPEDTKP